MITMTETSLRCGSTNPRAIKAAAEFPARLFAVHVDKIVLREGAIYLGALKPIDVSCSVCKHEWSPLPNNLLKGSGCSECVRQRNIISAGKRRCPRATKEEKARAALLRSEGHTYEAIAEMLGRSTASIMQWLDPEQAERQKQRARKRLQNPKVREQKRANDLRYYKEFAHGIANHRAAVSKRRALEWEAIFPVFVDNEWYEVDMSEHLQNWDDRQMFVDFQSCEDYACLQATAKEMAEIHGEEFHIDHLIPLSQGGIHHTDNFKIVPASYNLSKNNKRIPEDEALFCKRIFNIK